MTIDYKTLLEKYMRHVMQCEGIDFTDRLNERMSSEVEFERDEVVELKQISGIIDTGIWKST